MEDKISLMPIQTLHTAAPFKNLFPIQESVLNDMVEDMKGARGFDCAFPIIIWAGHKVTVIDGHTRLAAAQRIHLNKVPVMLKEFADEGEALLYAIRAQRIRRTLSQEELLNCLAELDKRNAVGRPGKTATNVAISGRTSESTAELLGISRGKVEKLRTINDHAPSNIRDAVASGSMSVDKGYKETVKKRRQEKATSSKPLSIEELKTLKNERLNALQRNIEKTIRKYLESEWQEYPELRYSSSEIQTLSKNVQNKIQEIIAAVLPGENEDEQQF